MSYLVLWPMRGAISESGSTENGGSIWVWIAGYILWLPTEGRHIPGLILMSGQRRGGRRGNEMRVSVHPDH
jgi:hypothetical protein